MAGAVPGGLHLAEDLALAEHGGVEAGGHGEQVLGSAGVVERVEVVAQVLGGDRRQPGGPAPPDRHRNVFCEAPVAVIQEIGIDLVADFELRYAAADGLYQSGNVAAEDPIFRPQQAQGGAGEEGLAAQATPVRRIHGDCQHLHEYLLGLRCRFLGLRQPKRLRRSVPLPHECLHDRCSRPWLCRPYARPVRR